MRTIRPILAAFAALAFVGLSPAGAHAQPAPRPNMPMQQHGPGGDIEKRVDRMLKRVNASAEQTTKVHAIVQTAKADIAPMRATLRDSRKQMRTLLGAPQIDPAAIETLRVQESTTRDQISRRVTAAIIEAANLLTPDQRAKLATMGPQHGPNQPR
jgi:protein CpxP